MKFLSCSGTYISFLEEWILDSNISSNINLYDCDCSFTKNSVSLRVFFGGGGGRRGYLLTMILCLVSFRFQIVLGQSVNLQGVPDRNSSGEFLSGTLLCDCINFVHGSNNGQKAVELAVSSWNTASFSLLWNLTIMVAKVQQQWLICYAVHLDLCFYCLVNAVSISIILKWIFEIPCFYTKH